MTRLIPCSLGRAALAGAVFAVLAAGAAVAAEGHLSAKLTGAAEVPGPGDTDGGGAAMVNVDTDKGEACYELTATGIAPAAAAHIHKGAAGASGPPVLMLSAPASGSSKACAAVDKAVAQDLLQNPANYYVNYHNAEFPGGAVRGQLGK
jgi:hypothetical protein